MEPFIFLFIFLSTVTKSAQFENLAFGKTVTVSKRYNSKNFDPSLAVDGDVSTDLLKCSLTASGEREAWLTVDLREVKNIASISFLHGGLGLNATFMDPSQSGIYPALLGNGTVQFFNKNTTICPYRFREEHAKVVCLNWGYLPDNPVWYKVDTSLSYEHREYRCRGYEAALQDCSNNGETCRNHKGKQIGISCESGDTLAGFSVYVSDTPDWESGTLCYQHDINEPVENNVSIDCFTTGRYVTIYNSRNDSLHSTPSSFAYINICEVNVTGCDIGYYGEECLACPNHCINNTCQMQVGHCFDCEDGYTGSMCEEVCPQGNYGKQCSFRCGSCLNQEPCHHVNGSCLFGCSTGWKGNYCNQRCGLGYFGFGCNSTCNNTNCLNSTGCEPSSGHCTSGCFSSWSGPFCQDCVQTFYGEQCNRPCSDNCQNKLCNQTTGQCFSCIASRYGVFCENKTTTDNAAATFDTNAGFIATSAIMVILLIIMTSYVVKRKWHATSTQNFRENYEISTLHKLTNEYEEIRTKGTDVESDNKASEYSEIANVEGVTSHTVYRNFDGHQTK